VARGRGHEHERNGFRGGYRQRDALVGAGLLGVLVLWKVLGAAMGDPAEENTRPARPHRPDRVDAIGRGTAGPAGSEAASFPRAVKGTRPELKVIALGANAPDIAEIEDVPVEGHALAMAMVPTSSNGPLGRG